MTAAALLLWLAATAPAAPPPYPPPSLTAVAGDGWVALSWRVTDPVAGFDNEDTTNLVTAYHVWRSPDGVAFTDAGTVGADLTSLNHQARDTRGFVDVSLTNGVPYTYQIEALSAYGPDVNWSFTVSATPMGTPPNFGALTTTVGTASVSLFVEANWPAFPYPAEPSATLFQLGVVSASSSAFGWTPPVSPPELLANGPFKVDVPIGSAGTPYFFLLQPCCPFRAASFASRIVCAPWNPAGPPTVTPDSSAPRAMRITWDPASPAAGSCGLAGYAVYRSDDGGVSMRLVASVACPAGACSRSVIDQVPSYGRQYVYLIRAVDVNGDLGLAYPLITVDATLPIDRTYLNHNLFRPALAQAVQIVYQVIEEGNLRISVFSLTGELVRKLYDGPIAGPWTQDRPFNSRDLGIAPVVWDGTNDGGELVASGAYLIVLEINKSRDIRTVAVLR